jgi:hypothetical protein
MVMGFSSDGTSILGVLQMEVILWSGAIGAGVTALLLTFYAVREGSLEVGFQLDLKD